MEDNLCSFESCDRKCEYQELCRGHYGQRYRGQPLSPLKPRFRRVDDLETFFWDRVVKSPDCWGWAGKKLNLGYGQIKFRGAVSLAHRYSFELVNGPIPEGAVIDHLCHNANCVRPDHLRIATHTQNMQNLKGAKSHSRSGVRGVRFIPKSGRWRVDVTANGKRHSFGHFSNIEEANKVAIEARRVLHS
jgi:hypothetical protein